MHSIYARINNVSAFLSSCTLALLAAIALSSFVLTTQPSGGQVSVQTLKTFPGNSPRYSVGMQEFTFVNFNISADLTPLFHWNTKQLFIYLAAEYENDKGTTSDVVIWDRIVRRKQDAHVNVVGRNKYAFRELSTSFANAKPAHYVLKYNLMPHVGALTYGEAARTEESVPFPPASALN